MTSLRLDQVPAGVEVFVDANIFIYHITGISRDCRDFLERCEARDVVGVSSVVVLAEVAHRLMMIEAVQRKLVTPGHVAKKLREAPHVVRQLTVYRTQVARVPFFNIDVRPVDLGQFLRAGDIRESSGLLVNDSLLVASAQAGAITHIASADDDFGRIEGLTRYRPKDLGGLDAT